MTTTSDNESNAIQSLTIASFEEMLRVALSGLFEELRRSEWYIREHEIVNLFTFGHLVPLFQKRELDLTMIGIECPVIWAARDEKSKLGSPKDLVIWQEPRTTLWKGCDLSVGMDIRTLRDCGRKPFAIVEWKATSRIRDGATARQVGEDHKADIEWLRRNLDGGMMSVGFAVLVRQDNPSEIRLECRKVSGRPAIDEAFLTFAAYREPRKPEARTMDAREMSAAIEEDFLTPEEKEKLRQKRLMERWTSKRAKGSPNYGKKKRGNSEVWTVSGGRPESKRNKF